MTKSDIEKIAAEAANNAVAAYMRRVGHLTPVQVKQPLHVKKKREFAETLVIVATFVCVATWIAAVAAAFLGYDFPEGLVGYAKWFWGAVCAVYLGKTAYEYKAKMQYGQREVQHD